VNVTDRYTRAGSDKSNARGKFKIVHVELDG